MRESIRRYDRGTRALELLAGVMLGLLLVQGSPVVAEVLNALVVWIEGSVMRVD